MTIWFSNQRAQVEQPFKLVVPMNSLGKFDNWCIMTKKKVPSVGLFILSKGHTLLFWGKKKCSSTTSCNPPPHPIHPKKTNKIKNRRLV